MTSTLRSCLGALAVLLVLLSGCNRAPYARLPRLPAYLAHQTASAETPASRAVMPVLGEETAPPPVAAPRPLTSSVPAPATDRMARPVARQLVQHLHRKARAASARLSTRHHDAAQRPQVDKASTKSASVGQVLLAVLGIGLAVFALLLALAALFSGSAGWLIASLLVFVIGIVLAVRSFRKMS